jgi:glycerophosphoryl diester phosphodiesterase
MNNHKMLASIPIGGLVSTSVVTAHPIPYHDLQGRLEVQGHQGGLGQRSEKSLWAFVYAMEVGVDTLEIDTVFTKNGVPVIWHDHYIDATQCSGDYVGDFIANLIEAAR